MSPRNDAARALGRRGGHARRDALSPERRSEIARSAARARWARERERNRMSEAEYLELPESMSPMELVDGEVVRSPAPTWGHQTALQRIVFELHDHLRRTDAPFSVGMSPLDVRIAPERILQPDAFLVRGRIPRDHVGPVDRLPELVVEVLSRNRVYDRVTKRLLYAAAGVPEMWTVDLDEALVERWTGAGLDTRAEHRDTLTTPLLPDFALAVPDLFTD